MKYTIHKYGTDTKDIVIDCTTIQSSGGIKIQSILAVPDGMWLTTFDLVKLKPTRDPEIHRLVKA